MLLIAVNPVTLFGADMVVPSQKSNGVIDVPAFLFSPRNRPLALFATAITQDDSRRANATHTP